ncbi:11861_t:CDS:1, partial [Racocetra fulgida]
ILKRNFHKIFNEVNRHLPVNFDLFIDIKVNNVVISLFLEDLSFNENFLNAISRYNPTLEYANTSHSFSTRPQSEVGINKRDDIKIPIYGGDGISNNGSKCS